MLGKSTWGLSKWGLKVLVHNCPRLPTIVVILCRKFPSEKGPKRPRKCTIVDDCAQIAESGFKPPFESPHLDFPEYVIRIVFVFWFREGIRGAFWVLYSVEGARDCNNCGKEGHFQAMRANSATLSGSDLPEASATLSGSRPAQVWGEQDMEIWKINPSA